MIGTAGRSGHQPLLQVEAVHAVHADIHNETRDPVDRGGSKEVTRGREDLDPSEEPLSTTMISEFASFGGKCTQTVFEKSFTIPVSNDNADLVALLSGSHPTPEGSNALYFFLHHRNRRYLIASARST